MLQNVRNKGSREISFHCEPMVSSKKSKKKIDQDVCSSCGTAPCRCKSKNKEKSHGMFSF